MRATMRADLTAALKARDAVAVAALRSALAAMDNAEAVAPVEPVHSSAGDGPVAGAALGVAASEAPRRRLTEDDLRTIVEREVEERRTSATDDETRGRRDRAQRLAAEADVLARYLP